jgi:hypothetical protein
VIVITFFNYINLIRTISNQWLRLKLRSVIKADNPDFAVSDYRHELALFSFLQKPNESIYNVTV